MASTPLSPPLIVDSHVHLWPGSEVSSLAWVHGTGLRDQRSPQEYAASVGEAVARVRGFVCVEADRANDVADTKLLRAPSAHRTDPKKQEEKGVDEMPPGFRGPMAEALWMRRVVELAPLPGEGNWAGAPPCLALVPWAPLPAGSDTVALWLDHLRAALGDTAWARVRAVRYLVQDAPAGTMLGDDFVAALRLLGARGLAFDLGIDQHGGGRRQLDEAIEMIARAHDGVPESERVTVIINHLCKPDLSIVNQADPSFTAWRTAIYTLSRLPRTYMKLSGVFAEMPSSLAQPDLQHSSVADAHQLVDVLQPWLSITLAAFGPRRLMYGSNWPVDEISGGTASWDRWSRAVDRLCFLASLGPADAARIMGGTALEAYGITDV